MQEYGLPQGAAVQEISGGSPADDAGLKKNDIITAVNGKAVTTSSELKRIISRSSPGDKLAISVYRQNEGTVEITAVVGERPQAEPSPEPESKQPGSGEYNWDNDPFGGFPFNGFPFGNFG